jgi:hypothetical protein
MSLFTSLTSHLIAIKNIYKLIRSLGKIEQKDVIKSIGDLNQALNSTRLFLQDPDFLNKKELDRISQLWNTAATSAYAIDPNLAEQLRNKSRYWADMDLFKRFGKDHVVIELRDIVDEIGRLEQILNPR